MQNRNATNSQVWLVRIYKGAAFEAGMDLVVITGADMSINQALAVTGQLGNVNDTITKHMGLLEYLPAP